jgi:hypothetical protein
LEETNDEFDGAGSGNIYAGDVEEGMEKWRKGNQGRKGLKGG